MASEFILQVGSKLPKRSNLKIDLYIRNCHFDPIFSGSRGYKYEWFLHRVYHFAFDFVEVASDKVTLRWLVVQRKVPRREVLQRKEAQRKVESVERRMLEKDEGLDEKLMVDISTEFLSKSIQMLEFPQEQ